MTSDRPDSHYQVIVVGGGTAGITIAARLAKAIPPQRIAIFEPSDTHYYQPLFTLVGGGEARLDETWRPTADLIPKGVGWLRERVTGFAPETNEVVAASGRYRYDYLVVCPGIHVDWGAVEGLSEALGKNGVCSNYSERYVEGTWDALRSFRGGTAIFTFPNTPVKCAGAPQKIMYLAEEHFRRTGVRDKSRVVFATAGDKIFGVQKYRTVLERIVQERGIEPMFKENLVAVDATRRVATFENLTTGARTEQAFDLLHVTPPMRAPDVVRDSPLASSAGWVDVDKGTLRHVRYPNVFAAGDASSAPTSKTGAAIRKQAPVVVEHLLASIHGETSTVRYDGYTSCPLVTGYGKLILAEFDYDGKPQETFPFDQSKERLSMYLLKKHVLPRMYWHGMLRGRV